MQTKRDMRQKAGTPRQKVYRRKIAIIYEMYEVRCAMYDS